MAAEIGLGSWDLDLQALARTETFLATEERLQGEVERALAERAFRAMIELVEARLGGFWSAQRPQIKTRWEVVANAGRVLLEAGRQENDLKGKAWTVGALLSGYVYGDQPWCQLDTAQRHLERDFHNFDLDPDGHESLVQLVTRARQRYGAVSNHLAEHFTKAYAEAQFELPGVLLQADVYRETVIPAIRDGRAAYILVDALRFEMARELLSILEQEGKPETNAEWTTDLSAALAAPPTVTEVGMAALLPGGERGVAVVEAGGKLAAAVAGQTLRTRQERMAHLEAAVEGKVVVTTLDQLAPLSSHRLREEIKAARLTAVTATEDIDTLCESTPALARRLLDNVLNQLRRGIKTLFDLGVQGVISADHGYPFGEKLSAGMQIEAPVGQTVALKRRVWVGRGGADLPGVLHRPLSAFGIGGELEMATPMSLACFKAKGGSTEYFHGGLSLQELVIPVLTVHSGATAAPVGAAPVHWTLTLGSQTISARFVSVTIEGISTQLLPLEPPMVRVEVRSGKQLISGPISATSGFNEITKDVELTLKEGGPPQAVVPNTVTLMITEEPDVDQVTVHLLDATTGISLARREGVPFAISI